MKKEKKLSMDVEPVFRRTSKRSFPGLFVVNLTDELRARGKPIIPERLQLLPPHLADHIAEAHNIQHVEQQLLHLEDENIHLHDKITEKSFVADAILIGGPEDEDFSENLNSFLDVSEKLNHFYIENIVPWAFSEDEIKLHGLGLPLYRTQKLLHPHRELLQSLHQMKINYAELTSGTKAGNNSVDRTILTKHLVLHYEVASQDLTSYSQVLMASIQEPEKLIE